MNGAIDWFCFPFFDSPSVFGAILDDEKGGVFCIWADYDATNQKQFYWPENGVVVQTDELSLGLAAGAFMGWVEKRAHELGSARCNTEEP